MVVPIKKSGGKSEEVVILINKYLVQEDEPLTISEKKPIGKFT